MGAEIWYKLSDDMEEQITHSTALRKSSGASSMGEVSRWLESFNRLDQRKVKCRDKEARNAMSLCYRSLRVSVNSVQGKWSSPQVKRHEESNDMGQEANRIMKKGNIEEMEQHTRKLNMDAQIETKQRRQVCNAAFFERPKGGAEEGRKLMQHVNQT